MFIKHSLASRRKSGVVQVPLLEIGCILALIAIFLLTNFITVSRSTTFLHDEVMFADPAVNLYLGHGFTTTAWNVQPQNEFWAGNTPLYSFLLYLWMKLFGFGLASVRSINYILMVLISGLVWLLAIKFNLVRSSLSRIALIFLLLTGEGLWFSYTHGRYDCLTISLFLGALLSCSIPSILVRYSVLGIVGILMPLAGLQLIAYLAVFTGLILLFTKRSFLKEILALYTGIVVGFFCLYSLYSTHGVWNRFVYSTYELAREDQGNHSFYLDQSFKVLLFITLGLTIYKILTKKFAFRSLLTFGLMAGAGIPIALYALGKYPIYYNWMAYLPLSICLCAELGTSLNSAQGKRSRANLLFNGILVSAIVCAGLVGLPQKTFLLPIRWDATDYALVENLVGGAINSNDSVFCDFIAYYPVKKTAKHTFLPPYLSVISPDEKQQISVLVITPERLQQVTDVLSTQWYDTGKHLVTSYQGLSHKKIVFNLAVYRRA